MNGFYFIYLIVCALTLCSYFTVRKEKQNFVFLIGSFFLVLMFVAQDLESGIDLHNYYHFYQEIIPLDLKGMLHYETWEFGFVVLNKLAHLMGMGPRMLYILLSLVTLVPLFVWMYQESDDPMLALYVFVALGFYKTSIGILRQWCAIAVLVHSCRFIKEKKLIPFLLMVGLAMLFHRTAGAFAVVYIACLFPVNKYIMMLAVAGSVALAVFGQPVMHFLNLFVRVPAEVAFNGGITMYVVLWTLTLLVYWLLHDRLNDVKVKVPFMMLLIAAATQSISFTFSNFSRAVQYFSVALTILVPELYTVVFREKEGNPVLKLLEKWMPGAHGAVLKIYDKKWFRAGILVLMFAVLFVWFVSMLNGGYYILAPLDDF